MTHQAGSAATPLSHDPTLSVVVPVTDAAPHLFEALWAICRQPAASEVLVVDLAGTAGRAVAAIADPRVRVLGQPASTQATAALARKLGLKEAVGTYVALADPAGLVADGALARGVATLERTGSDFVTGPAEQFGRERRRHWTTRSDVFTTAADGLRLDVAPALVLDRTPWTKVFRRCFLKTAGIVDSDASDMAFTTRAWLAATAVDVVQDIVCFRRNPSRGDADARWPGRPAAWVDGLADELRLLAEAGQHEAATLLASHALTVELPLWLDDLGRASAKVARRAGDLVTALAATAPASSLVRLPLRTRWQAALVARGGSRLLPALDQGAELAEPDALDLLDSLPDTVAASLGLDGRPPSEVFLDRFGTRRPRVWPAGPAAGPARADHPDISVVIPTYNVADYVDELLRSVRSAEGAALEFVVVDDRSDDGTWEKVQRHAADDPRIVAVRSTGKGGGWARNDGVKLARGDYLAFADGDDIVPPTAYAAMLTAARRSDADLVAGGYQKFFTRDGWDPNLAYDYRVGVDAVPLAGHPSLIAHRACWNRLIKRDFWLAHGFEFPSVPRSNDIAPMTAALTSARRITMVPDVVYLYRERPGVGSMTSKRGSVASMASYLDQEARCAAMVAGVGDPAVSAVYWWTFLGRDGYVHLRDYLATLSRDDPHHEVSGRFAVLLDAAPRDQVARLLPVQRALYALVALGKVDLAVVLADSLERDRVLSGEETAAILDAVTGSHLVDRETLTRLVWRLVHRRVIRDGGRDAAALLESARVAAARGAVPATVPGSAEERVARVIAGGTAADLASALAPAHGGKATLRAGLRSASVTGRAPDGTAPRLVAVTGDKAKGRELRVPLGRPSVKDGSWQATLSPGDLPKPGTWTLVLEFDDRWGLRRQVLKVTSSGLPSALARLSAFAGARGGAFTLRQDLVRRLAKAVRRSV